MRDRNETRKFYFLLKPLELGWEGRGSSYSLICPLSRLSFQLGTIPDLQGPGRPSGEEFGDLFPSQRLVFLQIDEKLVVFGGELKFRASWSWCWLWHLRHIRWSCDI